MVGLQRPHTGEYYGMLWQARESHFPAPLRRYRVRRQDGWMDRCTDAMAFLTHRIRLEQDELLCDSVDAAPGGWDGAVRSTLQTPVRTGYRRALSVFGVGEEEMADIALASRTKDFQA